VISSRLFAGPSQYPPAEFTAYGIVAFRTRASAHDFARHRMICEAYLSSLPHSSEVSTAIIQQIVTIWPLSTNEIASLLNKIPTPNICDAAVEYYGLVTSLEAIKDAESTGVKISGLGPFLLAWSPSASKGKHDALVLVLDLSRVTTYEQAQAMFLKWSREIENNPELWLNGWNVESLRVAARFWVDEYGPKVLSLFGYKK
jgi:hypothetical protein